MNRVPALLDEFDKKVERANKNKEAFLNKRYSKSGERLNNKVIEVQERHEQIKEKRELDVMGQVIMKHHKKA